MNIKHLILSLTILLAPLWAHAQDSVAAHRQATQQLKVRDFFISEPGNVFELLSQGVRAAMITMAEQGQKISADNQHDGTAKIDSLNDTYISVRCSDVKQVEMKMLTKGKADTVIAVVETVKLPTLDSRISFYDTNWHAIATGKCMKGGIVTMTDFIKKGTPADTVAEVKRHISFPLMLMTFGAAEGELRVSHQLQSFLSKEEYNKISPYLIATVSYRIDGAKLKRIK